MGQAGLDSREGGLDQAWQSQCSGKWNPAEDCGIFQGKGDLEVVLEVWWQMSRLGFDGEYKGQWLNLRASLWGKGLWTLA